MKAKFTPGPWKANHLRVTAVCNGVLVVNVDGPGNWARGKERDEELEYCKGNARLIAAAPELLDACKLALGWLESDLPHSGAIDTLKAAIAKATNHGS